MFTGIELVKEFAAVAERHNSEVERKAEQAKALEAEAKKRKWEAMRDEILEFGQKMPAVIRAAQGGFPWTPQLLQKFRAKVFFYVEVRLGLGKGEIPEHAKKKIDGGEECLELVEGLFDADKETAQNAWDAFVSPKPLFVGKEVTR